MKFFRSAPFIRRCAADAFISDLNPSQRRRISSSIIRRRAQCSPAEDVAVEANSQPKLKRLAVFFKEAVGFPPSTHDPAGENATETATDLSRELLRLETKLRSPNEERDREKNPKIDARVARKGKAMKNVKPPASSLHAAFTKRRRPRVVASERLPESSVRINKLSPEAEMFLNHLHGEGYFNAASFMTDGRLETGWYKHSCGRDFIKFAADKFAKDYQPIAKMLSGSELKKIALFGCPSVAKNPTSAAKLMRIYFGIPEQNVCCNCALRSTCKFVNQQYSRKVTKIFKNKLSLTSVLRVITMYALELVPPNFRVPEDLKASSNQLLRDIVELSQSTGKVDSKT